MKKTFTLILIIILVLALLVGGFFILNKYVFNSQEKQLIGKWENEENTGNYEFLEDGTVKVTVLKLSTSIFNSELSGTYEGKYTIEKDHILLSYDVKLLESFKVEKEYQFKIKDDVLYLTDLDKEDQEPVKYVRVK